jgi:hypothetical protein
MAQPTPAHTNVTGDDATRTSDTVGQNIFGMEGEPITMDSLPPPDTKRWVIRRKAAVVAAVRGGLLTLAEACERYTLSVEEFLSWQQAIEHHGVAGLRTTRLQEYRAEDN